MVRRSDWRPYNQSWRRWRLGGRDPRPFTSLLHSRSRGTSFVYQLAITWKAFSKFVSFAHVVAEPGKTYYFRARATYYSRSPMYLDLDAIDSDEGEYLVASSQPSTAQRKK